MKGKIKAVVFDLDNVLADSLHIYNPLLKKVLEKYGAKTSINRMMQFTGVRIEHIYEIVLKENGIPCDKKTVREMLKLTYKIFLKEVKKVRPVKGAKEFVSFVKKAGLKIAIATGAPEKMAKAVLENSRLHMHFKILV